MQVPPTLRGRRISTTAKSNKLDTPAPAAVHLPDTSAPTNTEDLVRDRPTVSGNPQNIGAVAREPGSHPINMADDHDNDHDSGLEDRTPHKNADTILKDTPETNGDKNSSNPGVIEALQNRLEQLEKEAQHRREKEEDLRREIRRRRELEDKLIKLEADLKTKATRPSTEDSSQKDQDPFTREIMKTKIPKDFKLPDMTLYDGYLRPQPSSQQLQK